MGRARKLVAFTRLLARLESAAPKRWVLKGGFALELRLGGQARATRDVDLDWNTSLEDATEALLEGAAVDLDDYFQFEIERVGEADVGAVGGIRFRADALVAGRLFEQLLIDMGIGQAAFSPSDELTALTYSTSPVSNLHVFSRLHSSDTLQRSFTPTRAAMPTTVRARAPRI